MSQLLAAQAPEGYWAKPGPGYNPKYTGTIWEVLFLSQYGASGSDGRILKAIEVQSRFVLGDTSGNNTAGKPELAYYRSGTSGPSFACANNLHFGCAWGAIKALLAFGRVPREERSQLVRDAIEKTADLLLQQDPAKADYPSVYGETPSASWFKFGHPLGYMSDVLQNLEALGNVGRAKDPRLANAIRLVESKRNPDGKWNQEYKHRARMPVDIEKPGEPSKWVTLRALRVLNAAFGDLTTD